MQMTWEGKHYFREVISVKVREDYSDYSGTPTGAVVTGQHPGKCGLPSDMSPAVSWLLCT